MTRDEIRFEELVGRIHLWPNEAKELERLADRLEKEVTFKPVKLEDMESDQ